MSNFYDEIKKMQVQVRRILMHNIRDKEVLILEMEEAFAVSKKAIDKYILSLERRGFVTDKLGLLEWVESPKKEKKDGTKPKKD